MTTSVSDNDPQSFTDSLLGRTSFREILGLETEHLLPGLDMAAAMLHRGDEEGALRTYATLVLFDPNEPRFQIGLAACALHLGLHPVALQAASAVIAFLPDGPEGYHLSAHACVGLEEYESAFDDFTEALRLARATGNRAIEADSERMLQRLSAARDDGATAAGQDAAGQGATGQGAAGQQEATGHGKDGPPVATAPV